MTKFLQSSKTQKTNNIFFRHKYVDGKIQNKSKRKVPKDRHHVWGRGIFFNEGYAGFCCKNFYFIIFIKLQSYSDEPDDDDDRNIDK